MYIYLVLVFICLYKNSIVEGEGFSYDNNYYSHEIGFVIGSYPYNYTLTQRLLLPYFNFSHLIEKDKKNCNSSFLLTIHGDGLGNKLKRLNISLEIQQIYSQRKKIDNKNISVNYNKNNFESIGIVTKKFFYINNKYKSEDNDTITFSLPSKILSEAQRSNSKNNEKSNFNNKCDNSFYSIKKGIICFTEIFISVINNLNASNPLLNAYLSALISPPPVYDSLFFSNFFSDTFSFDDNVDYIDGIDVKKLENEKNVFYIPSDDFFSSFLVLPPEEYLNFYSFGKEYNSKIKPLNGHKNEIDDNTYQKKEIKKIYFKGAFFKNDPRKSLSLILNNKNFQYDIIPENEEKFLFEKDNTLFHLSGEEKRTPKIYVDEMLICEHIHILSDNFLYCPLFKMMASNISSFLSNEGGNLVVNVLKPIFITWPTPKYYLKYISKDYDNNDVKNKVNDVLNSSISEYKAPFVPMGNMQAVFTPIGVISDIIGNNNDFHDFYNNNNNNMVIDSLQCGDSLSFSLAEEMMLMNIKIKKMISSLSWTDNEKIKRMERLKSKFTYIEPGVPLTIIGESFSLPLSAFLTDANYIEGEDGIKNNNNININNNKHKRLVELEILALTQNRLVLRLPMTSETSKNIKNNMYYHLNVYKNDHFDINTINRRENNNLLVLTRFSSLSKVNDKAHLLSYSHPLITGVANGVHSTLVIDRNKFLFKSFYYNSLSVNEYEKNIIKLEGLNFDKFLYDNNGDNNIIYYKSSDYIRGRLSPIINLRKYDDSIKQGSFFKPIPFSTPLFNNLFSRASIFGIKGNKSIYNNNSRNIIDISRSSEECIVDYDSFINDNSLGLTRKWVLSCLPSPFAHGFYILDLFYLYRGVDSLRLPVSVLEDIPLIIEINNSALLKNAVNNDNSSLKFHTTSHADIGTLDGNDNNSLGEYEAYINLKEKFKFSSSYSPLLLVVNTTSKATLDLNNITNDDFFSYFSSNLMLAKENNSANFLKNNNSNASSITSSFFPRLVLSATPCHGKIVPAGIINRGFIQLKKETTNFVINNQSIDDFKKQMSTGNNTEKNLSDSAKFKVLYYKITPSFLSPNSLFICMLKIVKYPRYNSNVSNEMKNSKTEKKENDYKKNTNNFYFYTEIMSNIHVISVPKVTKVYYKNIYYLPNSSYLSQKDKLESSSPVKMLVDNINIDVSFAVSGGAFEKQSFSLFHQNENSLTLLSSIGNYYLHAGVKLKEKDNNDDSCFQFFLDNYYSLDKKGARISVQDNNSEGIVDTAKAEINFSVNNEYNSRRRLNRRIRITHSERDIFDLDNSDNLLDELASSLYFTETESPVHYSATIKGLRIPFPGKERAKPYSTWDEDASPYELCVAVTKSDTKIVKSLSSASLITSNKLHVLSPIELACLGAPSFFFNDSKQDQEQKRLRKRQIREENEEEKDIGDKQFCSGQGVCNPSSTLASCDCFDWFGGPKCSYMCQRGLNKQTCSGIGSCLPDNSCSCDTAATYLPYRGELIQMGGGACHVPVHTVILPQQNHYFYHSNSLDQRDGNSIIINEDKILKKYSYTNLYPLYGGNNNILINNRSRNKEKWVFSYQPVPYVFRLYLPPIISEIEEIGDEDFKFSGNNSANDMVVDLAVISEESTESISVGLYVNNRRLTLSKAAKERYIAVLSPQKEKKNTIILTRFAEFTLNVSSFFSSFNNSALNDNLNNNTIESCSIMNHGPEKNINSKSGCFIVINIKKNDVLPSLNNTISYDKSSKIAVVALRYRTRKAPKSDINASINLIGIGIRNYLRLSSLYEIINNNNYDVFVANHNQSVVIKFVNNLQTTDTLIAYLLGIITGFILSFIGSIFLLKKLVAICPNFGNIFFFWRKRSLQSADESED